MAFLTKLFGLRLTIGAAENSFSNGYGFLLLMLAPIIVLIFVLAVRASNKSEKKD